MRIGNTYFNVIIPFVPDCCENEIFKEREREKDREDGNTCESTLSFLHPTDIIEYLEVPDPQPSSSC